MGSDKLKLGIQREGLIEIVLNKLKENDKISSDELARYIVKQVEIIEVEHKLKDDTSAACFYFRDPRKSIIFTWLQFNSEQDNLYVQSFYSFKGKKQ